MAEDTRPLCKCHGEPMLRDGHHRGKQKWQCGIHERARQARLYARPEFAKHKRDEMLDHWHNRGGRRRALARYRERKLRGVCTKCEAPILSESLCWNCLNDREEYLASR